jgi:hypothetical protein
MEGGFVVITTKHATASSRTSTKLNNLVKQFDLLDLLDCFEMLCIHPLLSCLPLVEVHEEGGRRETEKVHAPRPRALSRFR